MSKSEIHNLIDWEFYFLCENPSNPNYRDFVGYVKACNDLGAITLGERYGIIRAAEAVIGG